MDNKLHLLILLNRVPYPTRDGGAIATMNMLKGLHQKGVQLTILSLNTKKHYTEVSKLPSSLLEMGDWHFIDINTSINPLDAFLNLFSSKSYNVQRFFSIEYRNKLIDLLKNPSIKAVHLEGLHIGVYADVIKKQTIVPIVLRAHNIEYKIWERLTNQELNPLKKWYLNHLTKTLKRFEVDIVQHQLKGIIAISKVDEAIFNEINPSIKTICSPTGVDLNDYPTCSIKDQKSPNIYHLGSLDWMPNIEGVRWFLEEVYPNLKLKIPTITFDIAGRVIDESILEYAKKDSSITIHLNIDDAKKFSINQGICIVPLHSGSGMRIKILEAMAMGKAIVSTTIGAEGIPIANSQNILISDDASSFAEAIILLLKDEDKQASIGSNARQFIAKEFNNQSIMNELVEWYEGIIG